MIFTLLQNQGALTALAFILAIVVGISIHEFSHALAGYLMGDMTAKNEGRLTLNPLSHLDPVGSMMLLLAGFGWGRPTPYNPYNLRIQRWGPMLVAVAGPISNAVAVVVFLIAHNIMAPILGQQNVLIHFFQILMTVNLMLMIFNLFPIPPLDGSQILFSVLPPRFERFKYFLMTRGPILLFGVIILDYVGNVHIISGIFGFFLRLLGSFVV